MTCAKILCKAMTSMTEATLRDLPVWWFTWDVQAQPPELISGSLAAAKY